MFLRGRSCAQTREKTQRSRYYGAEKADRCGYEDEIVENRQYVDYALRQFGEKHVPSEQGVPSELQRERKQ
jgi:hypothetical protein